MSVLSSPHFPAFLIFRPLASVFILRPCRRDQWTSLLAVATAALGVVEVAGHAVGTAPFLQLWLGLPLLGRRLADQANRRVVLAVAAAALAQLSAGPTVGRAPLLERRGNGQGGKEGNEGDLELHFRDRLQIDKRAEEGIKIGLLVRTCVLMLMINRTAGHRRLLYTRWSRPRAMPFLPVDLFLTATRAVIGLGRLCCPRTHPLPITSRKSCSRRLRCQKQRRGDPFAQRVGAWRVGGRQTWRKSSRNGTMGAERAGVAGRIGGHRAIKNSR
ncbi:hypothetical protein IWZ00DRAFT_186524 [Phyllosticta capitalensis]